MTYRYWQSGLMHDRHPRQVPELLQKIADHALAQDYELHEAVLSQNDTLGRVDIEWDEDGRSGRALVVLAPGDQRDSLVAIVLTAMSDRWTARVPSPLHMLGLVSSEHVWPRCVTPFRPNILDLTSVPEDSRIHAVDVIVDDIVSPHRVNHLILAGTEVNRLILWSWPGIVDVVVIDDFQRKLLHDMNAPTIPPGQVRVFPAYGSAVPTATFDVLDNALTDCVAALMTEHSERPLRLEWNDYPMFTKWWHSV
ncbi:hypothetical protein NLX83_34035 [Allokutzneria sp. A3M-2-11 16]|uniref:hypothetical protein n=1 Tax=Allokutzneria sp. A3M-2-11 16 TaxID=2962043 RepID=UPI0020B767FD|nr:hypothetical protein [Allokutzneria sp. A3M-2-11 16]MCP3804300.1 hypothetical protein [Allokutzneria sp. A3M-2-11 16]